MVRGQGTSSAATPQTVILAQPSAIYITSMQFANTSSTTVAVSVNDSVNSQFIVPAGGGSNISFPVPLVVPPNTAFQFTLGTGVASVSCNAQGYTGSQA
jgi:hypothetical protein